MTQQRRATDGQCDGEEDAAAEKEIVATDESIFELIVEQVPHRRFGEIENKAGDER